MSHGNPLPVPLASVFTASAADRGRLGYAARRTTVRDRCIREFLWSINSLCDKPGEVRSASKSQVAQRDFSAAQRKVLGLVESRVDGVAYDTFFRSDS